MAYSTLSVLQKAGQLLHFQHHIENEVSETGKRLTSYLQQAIDEVFQETDWVFGIKLIELAPDASLEGKQYGFKHAFKLPNDCVNDVGLYPYYMTQGSTAYASPVNMYIMSLPFSYFGSNYRLFPLKFKRINNLILSDVDKALLEYVSNDQSCLSYVDKIWFINLIAYKLAIIAGATLLNTNDLERLEQKYSQVILPSSINKNCILKDKAYSYSDSGIYPYTQGSGTFY